jgi:lipoyl-dependent peroxiredoxin
MIPACVTRRCIDVLTGAFSISGRTTLLIQEDVMVVRMAEAEWQGSVQQGTGVMKLGSGAFEGRCSFGTRFGDEKGTNPEELIAAAHAGCFYMALALGLGQAGFTPRRIHTTANVHIERAAEGFKITRIELDTEAEAPGIDDAKFHEQAETAKRNCPVSRALAGSEIMLTTRLSGH